MLSGAGLKKFRTYLKIQVGHGWSLEGRIGNNIPTFGGIGSVHFYTYPISSHLGKIY